MTWSISKKIIEPRGVQIIPGGGASDLKDMKKHTEETLGRREEKFCNTSKVHAENKLCGSTKDEKKGVGSGVFNWDGLGRKNEQEMGRPKEKNEKGRDSR